MSGDESRIDVFLVDDHTMFREALAELIGSLPDIRVAGSADDIPSAVASLRMTLPDVVLLDYDLGKNVATDLFEIMPGIGRQTAVLILSAAINEGSVRRLRALGAAGVVWKHSGHRELTKLIRWAYAEFRSGRRAMMQTAPQPINAPKFTDRQLQVARAVLKGQATKEIAATLGVTDSSVKCTLQQVFAKTATRSRTELVRVLLERFPDIVLSGEHSSYSCTTSPSGTLPEIPPPEAPAAIAALG